MIFREYRNRELLTGFGTVTERRPYYYCDNCEKYGFFTDEAGSAGKLSPRATEVVCLLAQRSSFEETQDMIQRIFNLNICESTVKNIAENVGNRLYQEDGKNSEKAFIPDLVDEKTLENRAYLQIDGAMIHHLKEWKENKLAIMFSEADMISSGEGENERISLRKKNLVSSFAEGVPEFKKRLSYWLKKSLIAYHREIVIISDGAIWIENLVKDLLPGCLHILDWFHAKERLWKCAKALFGENAPENKLWVKGYADMLWDGRVEDVLKGLWQTALGSKKPTPLIELHQYFSHRKYNMNYKDYRKKGLYIGSGAIESANRYAIQDRLKKSGMKWSTRGGNAIAKLRTFYLSGQWETFWRAA